MQAYWKCFRNPLSHVTIQSIAVRVTKPSQVNFLSHLSVFWNKKKCKCDHSMNNKKSALGKISKMLVSKWAPKRMNLETD